MRFGNICYENTCLVVVSPPASLEAQRGIIFQMASEGPVGSVWNVMIVRLEVPRLNNLFTAESAESAEKEYIFWPPAGIHVLGLRRASLSFRLQPQASNLIRPKAPPTAPPGRLH